MWQEALVASAVLQWIVVFMLLSFVLSTLRLVGTLTKSTTSQTLTRESLRGINVSNERVWDTRTEQDVTLTDLINGQPLLLILADPQCGKCSDKVNQFISQPNFPFGRAVMAARAPREVLIRLAQELPRELRIVGDHSGLALGNFTPPYVFVLSSVGSYVASADLSAVAQMTYPLELLDLEIQREQMHNELRLRDTVAVGQDIVGADS